MQSSEEESSRRLGKWAEPDHLRGCGIMHETCQKFHYFEIYIIYICTDIRVECGIYEVSEAMLRLASTFLLEKVLGVRRVCD